MDETTTPWDAASEIAKWRVMRLEGAAVSRVSSSRVRIVEMTPLCLIVITVGDAGDMDRISAIFAGEIKAQCVE